MKSVFSWFRMRTALFGFMLSVVVVSCDRYSYSTYDEYSRRLSYYASSAEGQQYSAINADSLMLIKQWFSDAGSQRNVIVADLILSEYYYNSRKDELMAIKCLKEAEAVAVSSTDTLTAEIYHQLSHILDGRNGEEAEYYARKLTTGTFDFNTDRYHALGYKSLIRLSDNPDSSALYHRMAVEYFRSAGDTAYVDVINAFYVHQNFEYLNPDTALALLLPFYDRMHYDKEANLIAGILLQSGRPDEALPYIENLRGNEDFRYAYFYDMAIYYSLKGDLSTALQTYDRAHSAYQMEMEADTERKISEINSVYNRKVYEEQLNAKRIESRLTLIIGLLAAILSVIVILWLWRMVRRQRLKVAEKEKEMEVLSTENTELNTLTTTLSTNLGAMTDLSKMAFQKLSIDNYRGIMEVADILRDKYHDTYPDISRTEYAYIFMEFIGIPLKAIPGIMSVNIQTVYYQRHSVHKKLSKYPGVTIDNILDASFTTTSCVG